jgi:hypothetical protein
MDIRGGDRSLLNDRRVNHVGEKEFLGHMVDLHQLDMAMDQPTEASSIAGRCRGRAPGHLSFRSAS